MNILRPLLSLLGLMVALTFSGCATQLPAATILNTDVEFAASSTTRTLQFPMSKAGSVVMHVQLAQGPVTTIEDLELELNYRSQKLASEFVTGESKHTTAKVREGTNELVLSYSGPPGARLTLKIETVADSLVTQVFSLSSNPLAQTVVVNVEGLGAPVSGTPVRIDVVREGAQLPKRIELEKGFSNDNSSGRYLASVALPEDLLLSRTVTTDNNGVARIVLKDLPPGKATVVAGLPATNLIDSTIAEVPRVSVVSEPNALRMAVGQQRALRFNVSTGTLFGDRDYVFVRHRITPAKGALRLVRGGGAFSPGRQEYTLAIVEALATDSIELQGSHQLVTEVFANDGKLVATTTTNIDVVERGELKPRIVHQPKISPSGIAPAEQPGVVNMYVRVSGQLAPRFVTIEEVDANGRVLRENVARLRDDGKDADAHKGDRLFSGFAELNREVSSERYFRASSVGYNKRPVVSEPSRFLVTPFSLVAPASDPETIVPGPIVGSELFRNEVVVQARAGTKPETVSELARIIDGRVLAVIPATQRYLFEFPGSDDARGVLEAIKKLNAVEEVVVSAEPNYTVVPQAIPAEAPTGCMSTDTDCAWHVEHTLIKDAWTRLDQWGLAAGSAPSMEIAILESFGIDSSHPDLAGQCEPAASPECNIAYPHGTQVAGLIGAVSDGAGVAGVAFDSTLNLYPLSAGFTLATAIATLAADASPEQVVNISSTTLLGVSGEVMSAAGADQLLVASAGRGCLMTAGIPAVYPEVLGVGASDGIDDRAEWPVSGGTTCSNIGATVSMFAPGLNIRTTTTPGGGYAHVNGTSFSAPIVTGAAAVLRHLDASLTYDEISARLVDNGYTGIDELVASRLLDMDAALEAPVDLTLSLASPEVAEDCSGIVGNVVTVSAVDPTTAETFAFTFLNGAVESLASGPFVINSTTGAITVAAGCPLDFSVATSHNVTVRVRDVMGLGYDETFAIGVTEVPVTASETWDYDFESPVLGAGELRREIDPLAVSIGSFSIADNFGFVDAVTGLVRNDSTSACSDPANDNQKLAVGRSSFPDSIGFSGFPIRLTFDSPLPAGPAATTIISAEFSSASGQTARIRLYNSSDVEVDSASVVLQPDAGTCSFPGDPRARSIVSVSTNSTVAYAEFEMTTNTPSGGVVYTIDNVSVAVGQ